MTNITKIIQIITFERNIIETKAIKEVYFRVTQEIIKFNNDLAQFSCKLTDKIIESIHLSAIYIIWKEIMDKKIQ